MTIKKHLKRQNSQDTRTHVVGELYDTERSYVESLQVLIEKYMKPLKSSDSNKSLIDSNLVDEIFYSIPEILQHHENFLSALQAQLSSDWDSSQVIGNVFIEAFTNQQIIDTYTAFINNWKNARHAIKVAIQAKPAFERFLEAVSREHRNKLTLDALLIMPVQRIPRYELLIKELIKHTPEDHPDHGPLIVAQKEIHELALKIDRAEKEMIHQEQLKDLESLIEGHAELQHPQRDFVRYDLVTISASSLTITRKERVLFLFCDLLIMTSVKKKVSRRANLQAAFANSTNDISLLEGNKFKLILRVSLDQVDIRHDSHNQEDQNQLRQHQQHQQQSYEQHLQALEMQRQKLIQDKRHELERDLYALQQMELLANQISHANAVRTLVDNLHELMEQTRHKLNSLEQQRSDCEASALAQHLKPVEQPSQPVKDLYLVEGPISGQLASSDTTVAQQLPVPDQRLSPTHSSQSQVTTPATISKDHHHHQTSSGQVQDQDLSSGGGGGKQSQEVSLEFVIYNSNAKDTHGLNLNSLSPSGESRQTNELSQTLSGQNSTSDSQTNNAVNHETLVVTFATHDRRQAFLQAFLDAKQQRLQQQQQQQQKMFSSSLSLRLAHPDSQTLMKSRSIASDLRRNRLQHQDEVFDMRALEPAGGRHVKTRCQPADSNSSGTCAAGTIKHQMSAPLSIASGDGGGGGGGNASTADKTWSNPLPVPLTSNKLVAAHHCVSCSPSDSCALDSRVEHAGSQQGGCTGGGGVNQMSQHDHHHYHHHHHHHQLMHQPASHPALLHTICCHEQHNENNQNSSSKSLDNSHDGAPAMAGSSAAASDAARTRGASSSALHSGGGQFYCPRMVADSLGDGDSNSIISLAQCDLKKCSQLDDRLLMLKFVPRFLMTMPMTFLNTQHPALQFTNPVSEKFDNQNENKLNTTICNLRTETSTKCQAVRDDKSQLWLCMSNGYVSHVALVKFKKKLDSCANQTGTGEAERCYTIVPVVQSGGDICRSQINCAAQVSWSRRARSKLTAFDQDDKATKVAPNEDGASASASISVEADRGHPEVLIKSASPPVRVEHCQYGSSRCVKAKLQSADNGGQSVSSSAPSDSTLDSKFAARKLSASFTQLSISNQRGPSKENSSERTSQASNDSLQARKQVSQHDQRTIKRSTYHKHHHQSHDHLRCRNICLHNTNSLNRGAHCRDCLLRRTLTQQSHHHHSHLHHQHAQHHLQNYHQSNNQASGRQNHHNHMHHYHHHHHHHHHHHNQAYYAKHHTVPLAELRRALERQSRTTDACRDQLSLPGNTYRRRHLAPPANTPSCLDGSSQDSIDRPVSPTDSIEKAHSTTPPPGRHRLGSPGSKSFRSAKMLRHQASLKTSSILAKLVSSAGKGSSYLRKSSNQLGRVRSNSGRIASNDEQDNDESDANNNNNNSNLHPGDGTQQDTLSVVDTNPANSSSTHLLNTSSSININNQSLVSPLSSVSSLNSTNSSLTVNSVCASAPNHGSCAVLHNQPHWVSTTCCTAVPSAHHLFTIDNRQNSSSREDLSDAGNCPHRSRSATVPCRSYCEQTIPVMYANVQDVGPSAAAAAIQNLKCPSISENCSGRDAYKVSGIVDDAKVHLSREMSRDKQNDTDEVDAIQGGDIIDRCTSLWLGCDDGSLVMIDCLATPLNQRACNLCEPSQQVGCQNVHSELKLRAPISDIKNYKDEIVFVALADGRLVVFKRARDYQGALSEWQLTQPQILTIASSELNLTSRLCLVDDNHLWYSYGRNIFVLIISSLELETTIMTPTNDPSIQFTMQTITIDTMELVEQLDGVWLSFRGNPLLQFYDIRGYKLLLEMSLLDSINKVLSCGNEILRLHKTACLGATSLLSIYNEIENTNSLFVGTSAGIIIYLTLSLDQLREQIASERSLWSPQVISLRHGHSGQVRFLRLVELELNANQSAEAIGDISDHEQEPEPQEEATQGGSSLIKICKRNLCLVSGGAGVDLYGPTIDDGNQRAQENLCVQQHPSGDDDCLNHLILWQLC